MMKRMNILALSILVMACTQKPDKQASMNETEQEVSSLELLVGTYTGQGSDGIYQLSFNPETGELTDPKLMAELGNPSFLTISPDRQYVYSVSEGDSGVVAAFKWENQKLNLINSVSSGGANPCYIDLHQRKVVLANYSSGNGGLYEVQGDGSLRSTNFAFQHEGTGPNESRQEAPHAHFSRFSSDGKFLYVVDLGIDQVMIYPVVGDSIGAGSVAFHLQPGDGPRHIAFDDNRNRAFIVTELSNAVVAVNVDQQTGVFEEIDRKSTLPEAFEGESYCADIHISEAGQFLYVSNRGANSIAIFEVDQDGKLELIGSEMVKGNWPRNFIFSPDEKFLLVANQESNNIVVFAKNPMTGLLTDTGHQIELSKPVCLVF